MATEGILRPSQVVFYHPLDNETEYTKTQAWTGSAGFVVAKVGSGKSGVTGTSVSFGSPTTGGSGLLPQGLAEVTKLTATKMLICYPATSTVPAAMVATINGTSVTFGPEHTFADGYDIRRVSCATLSSTTVIMGHFGTGADHWYRCLTISRTDVTSSSTVVYNGVGWFTQDVVAIDSTRALAIMGETGKISLAVLTVSGGVITMGAVNSTVTDGSLPDAAALLDSTRVVFNYSDDSANGQARIAVISGTSVTVGPATQFCASHNVTTAGGDISNGDITSLGGGKFVTIYKRTTGGRLVVGAATGTDITFGAEHIFIAYYGHGQVGTLTSNKAIVIHKNMDSYPLRSRAFTITISGLDITEGAEVGFSVENGTTANGQINVLAVIDQSSFFAFYTEYDLSERRGVVGQISLTDASLTGGAGYPSTIGDTRVAVAMWSKNLTGGSTTVRVERGYNVEMTSTSISLGGTTAVWDDAGISSLMTNMNNGSDHLLVLDFENSGTDWTLSTSFDGDPWVDQGIQNTGSQAVTTTDTSPMASLTNPEPGQWIDELVMWSGDKVLFEQFTSNELANLYDLAGTFDDQMFQYEANYDSPICWQATAVMPDGTVWRDSGGGPCPAVIRVPRGASNVIVTDDGVLASSTRIQEG